MLGACPCGRTNQLVAHLNATIDTCAVGAIMCDSEGIIGFLDPQRRDPQVAAILDLGLPCSCSPSTKLLLLPELLLQCC